MSALFHVLLIAAVVALVVVRQFTAQRIGDDKRWWVLPGILLIISARNDGALDPHHEALSALILGAGIVVGLVTGAGWGWTARLWREPDGSVWSRGTKGTVQVWVGGLTIRAALAGAGVLLGIHQGPAALTMSLAAMLLARGGVLSVRALRLRAQHGGPADGMPLRPAHAAWKGHA
ncbi:DUF1453 domain-containing protein [Streptomyces sp. NPDC001876]|uniref:DUF1453 domain-containing protein n=1 Tax=Streptomyces sp. NPDC001876 TaxID=3154402 RepID=UPI0033259E4A